MLRQFYESYGKLRITAKSKKIKNETYEKSGKFSILRKLTKLKFESYEFDNLYRTKKRTATYNQ